MQYACSLGHGSRKPNGRREEEFAERDALSGEYVILNGSKQMPQVGYWLISTCSGGKLASDPAAGAAHK